MYEKYSERNRVICQMCGKDFLQLTTQHIKICSLEKLNKEITSLEYKTMFPGYPIVSQATSSRISIGIKQNIESKKEIKNQDNNSKETFAETNKFIELKDLKPKQKIDNNITIQLQSKKEDKPIVIDKKVENKDIPLEHNKPKSKEFIMPNKSKVFNFLKTIYKDLEINYFVEKINLGGLLEYRYVTDMTDPINKIIFDFPNTFWHNTESMYSPNRESNLKRDGWTIITFLSNSPTTDEIKERLYTVTEC